MNPEIGRLLAQAAAHHQAGRFAEAEAAYRTALGMAPKHAAIMHNLGVVMARQGKHAAAIRWFDAAIAAEPRYASAHYNRAAAYVAVGKRSEAIAGFARASALEPGDYASHRALGFLLLAEGDRNRALDHFARTYELRRGDDRGGIAARSLDHATRLKLLHDAEQFRYCAARGHDRAHFTVLARNYQAAAADFPNAIAKLRDADRELLGESYNTAIALADAPEIPGGALAARPDRNELVREFSRAGGGAVAFDDLLSPVALARLRRYLLESTIWHDFSHIRGFLAAYLEDGLACPLLLQIADELRGVFPGLLGEHPLSQAWAFKALEPTGAVGAHADDGAISINFWVTPTEACLDPVRGGLTVCLVRPPPDWPIAGYDADRQRAVMFLEQNAQERLVVPYKENRAVLFDSRLVHASDAPIFRQGYENHRINITLLFGSGSAGRRDEALAGMSAALAPPYQF